jgi:hypothetical protein
MSDKIVLTGSDNIQGDITSCKIEKQLKTSQRDSVFSLSSNNTYMTYDVCNKNQISEYTVPEFTGFGVFVLFAVFVFVLIGSLLWVNRW